MENKKAVAETLAMQIAELGEIAKPVRKKNAHQIVKLWGKQKKILEMKSQGYSIKEIIRATGMEKTSIQHILGSELGRNHMAMIEGASTFEAFDIISKVKALSPVALEIQEMMLLSDDTSPRLVNDIANKILDRAGHAPVTKTMNANLNVGLTKEDLDAIKARAKELSMVEVQMED